MSQSNNAGCTDRQSVTWAYSPSLRALGADGRVVESFGHGLQLEAEPADDHVDARYIEWGTATFRFDATDGGSPQ